MRNLKKQSKNGIEENSEIPSSLPIYDRLLKFRKTAMQAIFVFLFMFANISGTNSITDISAETSATEINKMTPQDVYVMTVKGKFQQKLIEEVENYITRLAPTSKLDPGYLVTECLEYDTDIVFVLSQALLESHFGTKGVAIRTNSVWNVGAWDDGQLRYWYSHPNKSIEPYLKLINEDYLINVTASGDTIYKDLNHLLKDRGYVNHNGARYASARGYENGLRKLMIEIDQETSISFYQEILRLSSEEMIAYFVPSEDLNLYSSSWQAMNYE